MMNRRLAALAALLLAATPLDLAASRAHAQEPAAPAKKVFKPIARTGYRTAQFRLDLRTDTQTLARLSPTADAGFDFVPGAREAERQGDGYVHVGDIHLRLRTEGGAWRDFSSARQPAARPWRRLTSPRPWVRIRRFVSSAAGSPRAGRWPYVSS